MPPPVDNTAPQGQPQVMQYDGMGYYNIANDNRLHQHHNDASNDYAAFALDACLDVSAQAQATAPATVCTDFIFPHTCI